MSKLPRRAILALGTALAIPHRGARAQSQPDWPTRPVRIIVPVAAGGSVDILARTIAPALQERLGQSVTVENRTGANGSIGGMAVAQSGADGHMLLISASMQPLARLVMRNPGYDPMTDLLPVGRLGEGPLLMTIAPGRPQRTLAEVVAAARANPRDWSLGVGSLGSAGHLATIELARIIGADVTLVPYRGSTPAVIDLMGGRIGLHMDPVLAMLPPVRDGTLRGIAVTAPQRLAAAPEIPTTAEAGFPSIDVQSWWGLWGPRALPGSASARLQAEVAAVMADPAIRARLAGVGVVPMFESAADFAAFQSRDFARAEQLFRLARVEPE
jgi:tripartite-type tricarboxylate transporter receptor subunit TctC